MPSSPARFHAAAAAFLLLATFVACGGQTAGAGADGGGGAGGAGGGAGTGGGGGGSCVTVQPSSLSRSCATAADCTLVPTGTLCSGACDCGDTPISTSALAAYDAETASISLAACPCPYPGAPDCVNGVCTLCGPNGCSPSSDAGSPPPPDAGVCIDVTASMFDTSCAQDSDCISVTLGELCSSGCLCGGSSINVAGEGAYKQMISGLPTGVACACPYFGTPRCVAKECTICSPAGNQPGCPDAGP